MLNAMRKIAVAILAMVMLLPAVGAASIPDECDASAAQDHAASGQFSPPGTGPAWLGGATPTPRPSSTRIIVAPAEETQRAIGRIVSQVSSEYILSYLTRLQGYGSRYVRAPGMYNATAWLYNALQDNGRMQAELQDWSYVNASGVTHWVSNIILTLPGMDAGSDRVYYLFNHADSTLTNWTNPGSPVDFWELMNMAPGADDDGTGVAATLEAARVLSRFQFQDTIRFAFFNGEEIGLVGSQYWAQVMAARGENVPASIDFDMIGNCPGNAPYELELASDQASYGQVGYMMDVNDRYGLGLLISPVQTSGSMRSDIDVFYAYGYPGVMGIEYTFSPNYHSKQDRVEYLNTTLVTRCSRLAVATLSEMARLLYVDVSIPPGNLTVSDEHPDEGVSVTIAANITNTGNLNASDLEVSFCADGVPFASRRIWVPANGTNSTSAPWKAVTGSHRLSVVLDPDNDIWETDESNNTANITVFVNDLPKAVLTPSTSTALTNESVIFDGSLSSDVIGGVTGYNFSFGDGNGTGWTSAPQAAHTYPRSGTYAATLQVRDADGALSGPASAHILVKNRGPAANPISNQTRVLTYEPVQFRANASDPDGNCTVSWDFGDGAQSAQEEPVHNYSRTGDYDVLLTVTDDEGSKVSYAIRMFVKDRPPVCDINASLTEGNIETQFAFNSSAYDPDGTIASYYWDLGDGNDSRAAYVRHTYARPGNYLVMLTVVDDDGSDCRDMMMIAVEDMPPSAQASLSPAEVSTFQAVHFDGRGSLDLEGPITFHWDFGDGNGSLDPAPSHSYARSGDYSPRLTVADSSGQNSSVNLTTVHVRNRLPSAEFRAFGCFTQNGTVYFDASGSSDPEGDILCKWNFGDGGNATGLIVEHVFAAAGNYSVNLTVTDIDQNSSTQVQVVRVFEPPPQRPLKTSETLVKDQSALVIGLSMLSAALLVLLIAVVLMKRRG
jgi:PKD repeat protein